MADKTAKNTDTLCENLSFAAAESYKRLRTNVMFSFADGAKCHVIGVTSAHMSDGKSTTAVNFAYTLAGVENKRVLLIDADMRRPSVHDKLSFDQAPGLSNLLVSINSVSTVINTYHSSENDTSVDVICSGDTPPNPAELLNSARMKNLVARLKEIYDYIVIDLPPVGAVADAQLVSTLTDGMIIVVRENNCPREALSDCISQLQFANAKILGFVMNGTAVKSKGYGYGKYGNYGYGYGYGAYK